MSRTVKAAQKSDIQLAPGGPSAAKARGLLSALKKEEKNSSRLRDASNRELDALQAEYRRKLSTLLSPSGLREFDEIRNATLSRAQKDRRALEALKAHGVDRAQMLDLRRPYLRKALAIMARDGQPSIRLPHDGLCDSPFVTYLPPYGGRYWSYYWERSSNTRVPIFGNYLENSTGRVGSRIRTSVSGADDEDSVYVEYHTGFNLWYVAQKSGPLEVQLTFEFPRAVIAGKVTDEWGWSDVTHYQIVWARMRATNSQAPGQFEDSLGFVDSVAGYADGHNDNWTKQVSNPFETRTYRFKTAVEFALGTPVLLQAGLKHVTQWDANDMSVSTDSDIDMRLKRVEVRSCSPYIVG